MRETIDKLLERVRSRKYPERWAEIYDEAMDDFEKNGLNALDPAYYDRVSRDYGALTPHLDDYKRAAAEIAKDETLSRVLALVCFAMRDRDSTGGKLPIYLCGVSMGATTVLMAAGQELPENVHGIISDCAFTSPHAIWKHVVKDNLHLPYAFRGYTINRMFKRRLNTDAREYSTVQALEKNTVPIFFAHGGADRFVPLEMTFENYRACKAEKRLLVVPEAIHGLSYYYDKERYEAALLDFFRDFD